MTSREIRKADVTQGTTSIAAMLREIAAQLAEFNERDLPDDYIAEVDAPYDGEWGLEPHKDDTP